MGRITVFALDECPHCKRAKTALKDRNIPFTEISLSSHPNRRTDMLSPADRLTVPQIFFNERHIGGADDTLKVLEAWDKQNDNQSPLKTYMDEVGSKADPTDERLRKSTEPPVQQKDPLPRDEADNIEVPDGTTLTVMELTEKLKKILSGKDKVTPCRVHKNSFTGSEGVAALAQEFDVKEKDAVVFGGILLEREIIQPVAGHQDFGNSKIDLFRLQCYHTPNILNSYRVWDTRVDSDAVGVLTRLKKLLGKVESAVTNKEGLVDYKKARETEHWPIFEEAVCELQGIDIAEMDFKTRMAFGINLYNMMIKYSFMKVGIYADPFGLMSYFSDILFNVGGCLYGFHDLESGVLRGNRPPPYALSAPIPKNDSRLSAVLPLSEVDCRIHFGLNVSYIFCCTIHLYCS